MDRKIKKTFRSSFVKCDVRKTSCDVAVELFKKKFKQIMETLDLTPDQVYNADESGLFYRLLTKVAFATSLKEAQDNDMRECDHPKEDVTDNQLGETEEMHIVDFSELASSSFNPLKRLDGLTDSKVSSTTKETSCTSNCTDCDQLIGLTV
ncbi:hypothetical protein J6590_010707 [Homalodisca vitripennis]|nr:hypothetical protein J6590_010707 [Homalodisca vitripennis]